MASPTAWTLSNRRSGGREGVAGRQLGAGLVVQWLVPWGRLQTRKKKKRSLKHFGLAIINLFEFLRRLQNKGKSILPQHGIIENTQVFYKMNDLEYIVNLGWMGQESWGNGDFLLNIRDKASTESIEFCLENGIGTPRKKSIAKSSILKSFEDRQIWDIIENRWKKWRVHLWTSKKRHRETLRCLQGECKVQREKSRNNLM